MVQCANSRADARKPRLWRCARGGICWNSDRVAAGLTGVSNLSTSVAKTAEESTNSLAANEDKTFEDNALSFLNVEIIGFGEGVE